MRNAPLCPKCRKGHLQYRTLRLTGDVYTVCENYPECSYVGDLEDVKPSRRGTRDASEAEAG